jgi:hypothetical protein
MKPLKQTGKMSWEIDKISWVMEDKIERWASPRELPLIKKAFEIYNKAGKIV